MKTSQKIYQSNQRCVLSSDAMALMMERLSMECLELVSKNISFAVIGLQTRGVFLGKRMVNYMKKLLPKSSWKYDIPLGFIDITLYRDDLYKGHLSSSISPSKIPFDIDNMIIFIVDDVIHTGRTIRCAMEAILAYGRPKKIYSCCLVDRRFRELPIHPDIYGIISPVYAHERIEVRMKEIDKEDGVYIISK